MDARLDNAQAQLRAVRVATRSRSLDDAGLKAQLAVIPPIQADLADILSNVTPRLADAQARLAELGAAPADGQPPEASDIAANRARLTRSQQTLDGDAKRARMMTVEAGQLADTLTRRLQQNFSTRLWARSRSVFDPALWGDFAYSLPGDLQRLGPALQAPAGAPAQAGGGVWLAVPFLLLGLILLVPARIMLDRLGRRWSATIVPSSSLRKSALAVWMVIVGGMTPLLAALALRQSLAGMSPMTPVLDGLATAFISALFFGGTIEAIGRSLLSPENPSWRLAPISDSIADRLAYYPMVIGVAVGLVSFITSASDVLEASPATSAAYGALAVAIQLAVAGWGLTLLGQARSAHAAATTDEEEETAQSRLPWILAAFAAWLALIASLVALVAGYLALATFVMNELIWIAMVLASLFILMQFIDDLCQALFSSKSPVGRLFETAIGLSENALEQIGILLSGALRLGLMLLAWVAIVAPFGASAEEILGRVTSTEAVFKLGQLSISPGLIIGGLAVFGLGLAITRVIRGWLVTTYLPKTRIDVGLRTSITAGLTYLGALIAVVMTCAYLGLSLDKIALLASALSVGIGFGLQAVISNFVSGLILLAERPVKVGDWIAIGDLEGDVRRINIRATEIEMTDRSKLIVPNSDLISKQVRNITHGGALARIKLVIKVANDAGVDAGEIRDFLLSRLKAHGEILGDPAPGVFLTGVPDGALEFTALAHVASARDAFRIKSELLLAMVADLKAKGVALAGVSGPLEVRVTGQGDLSVPGPTTRPE
jgi:potassium efflux system protein